MTHRFCIVCGNELPKGKRRDAVTCSDRCRLEKSKGGYLETKNQDTSSNLPLAINNKQDISDNRKSQLIEAIDFLKNRIAIGEQELATIVKDISFNIQPELSRLEWDLHNQQKELSKLEDLLSLPNVDLFNKSLLFDEHLPKDYFTKDLDNLTSIKRIFYDAQLRDLRKKYSSTIILLRTQIKEIELKVLEAQNFIEAKKNVFSTLKLLIQEDKKHLIQLQSILFGKRKLRPPSIDNVTEDSNQKILEKKRISGKSLLHTHLSPTIEFAGNLGKFLGQVERHRFFLALTGDAGVGKSELAFHISKLFTLRGFRVLYISLEMGINADVQRRVSKYQLLNNFEIWEDASIEEVKEATNEFECIIIDSFNKLNIESEQLDQLRIEFNNTFFIGIFQKTTGGTMRGGSKVIFDCTMNIDIRRDENGKRVAIMVKSRYGTQGWKFFPEEDLLAEF